jgi:alpha-1,6-mannosyltransferase
MKSLHLTNYYHESSGGVRTLYQALLDAGNRLARPVRLVVPGTRDSVRDCGAYGRIYTIAAPRAPFDASYRLLYPHHYLPSFAGRIREILQVERPDVIEISDKYTLCYLAGIVRRGWIEGLGRPLLVGSSNERMDDGLAAVFGGRAVSRRFARWYMRRIYLPQFDYQLANSEYTAEEVSGNLEAHRAHRFRVVPPGVDARSFGPQHRDCAFRANLLTECRAAPDAALLLYVGRLSPEKNLPLLLDAAALLRDRAGLVLAGDGAQRAWLESEAVARHLPVRTIGHVESRHRLATLYASCDAFLHPNPREPFGIAPLEAMASGCPVVLPKSGGVLTYATAENAWLCQPSATDFAAAVARLMTEPEERQRRTAAGRATAWQYRWERVAQDYFTLLDDLRNEAEYAS